MAVRIQQVAPGDLHRFSDAAARMEGSISYPLGNDRFTLDHGQDYFRFSRRMGEPHFRLAWDGDALVGMGAAVLRTLPLPGGALTCWYICDVKVLPAYQARGVAVRLVMEGFLEAKARCPRAYAISMNPPRGPNPVVRLARRWFGTAAVAGTLEIHALEREAMRAARPALEKVKGPVTYRSLGGVKDVVLRSTGRPMPLFHVQNGPCAEPGCSGEQDGVHMFCGMEGTLPAGLGQPVGTATVLHRGMEGVDMGFILTSDI